MILVTTRFVFPILGLDRIDVYLRPRALVALSYHMTTTIVYMKPLPTQASSDPGTAARVPPVIVN